jgi:hypothetical protein
MKTQLLVILVLVGMGPVLGQKNQKKLKQGIEGKVFWIAGNQMPGPDRPPTPQVGVKREILVYEKVRASEATQQNGFFVHVPGRVVAQVESKPDGSFRVKLPPGEYSVLVKEQGGLFANLFDQDNFINPVSVKPKTFSWLTIAIDYEAAY